MNRFGIIDIGSNSVRLVIVDIINNKYFRIVHETKEAVRLGKDIDKLQNLNSGRMKYAVDTINNYKTICDAFSVDKIIAVATEAVRRSSNQSQFLKMVQKTSGINIAILSGKQEAYYDYIGAINSLDVSDCLLVDVGGSSTEIVLVKDRKLIQSISIPYGSISFTDEYKKSPQSFANNIKSILKKYTWLKQAKDFPLVGIGGTFRNIGKIDRKRRNYPLDLSNNYTFLNQDFRYILCAATSEQSTIKGKKLKGLSTDRADIFCGPVAAISELISYCGTKNIVISGSGVREGLIYEQLLGEGKLVPDVLDYSLGCLVHSYCNLMPHCEKVYELAYSLYEQLNSFIPFDRSTKRILKAAALLHDSGVSINFYNHHKHSFYLILNSRLNGLSHREILLAAYVAALHRKDGFKLDLFRYRSLINKNDILVAQKLGTLVKICESLDFRMNGCIKAVTTTQHNNSIIIKLISDTDTRIEADTAMKCQNTFRKVFGKNLMVV